MAAPFGLHGDRARQLTHKFVVGCYIEVAVCRRGPLVQVGKISEAVNYDLIIVLPERTRDLLKLTILHSNSIEKQGECLFSLSVDAEVRIQEAKTARRMYVKPGAPQN